MQIEPSLQRKTIAQSPLGQLIAEYTQLVQQRIDQGFDAFLLTFMFQSLAGSPRAPLLQMNHEVKRFYAKFLTRVVRKPKTQFMKDKLPVLITVPDQPAYEVAKGGLSDLNNNGGLHIQGILCVPRNSRLKIDVPTHFQVKRPLYVTNNLLRIDVKPIHFTGAAGYALFKALRSGNATADDIKVYPGTDDIQLGARLRADIGELRLA
jgi:hypothetical protein